MTKRLHLIFWCVAIGIFAFVVLDSWSQRNSPLYKRFERQWAEDIALLEASQKLPPPWYDVKDIELYGGTPESKDWLARIKVPLRSKKEGHYKLEVLVVVWQESGKRGVLTQYNFIDQATQNNVWELGRTLILTNPEILSPWKSWLQEFSL